MRKSRFLGLLSIVLISTSANADILYENALTTPGGGNYSFSGAGVFGAENFTLFDDSSVSSISFNAYHTRGSADPTDIDWMIYSDSLNMPGSILASGNSTTYTTSVAMTSGSYDLVDYMIDVSSLSLFAGDYWVAFSPNGGANYDPHWSFTSGDGLSAISTDGGATWSSPYPGNNMAFRIEGTVLPVPEPASIALLGIGLAAIGFSRRRQKQ